MRYFSVVLLFFLVCTNATAISDDLYLVKEKPATPEFLYTLEKADSVKAKSVFPENFISVQPNLLTNPQYIDQFYQKLLLTKENVKILHLGDSHVAGRIYPCTVRDELQKVWSVELEDTTLSRVDYHYIAKNGATFSSLLSPERIEKIKMQCPDLLILSFGTNECHSLKYNLDVHSKQLAKSLALLKELCPGAEILVTTPPGAYLKYQFNPMTRKCVDLLSEFAEKNKLAFWNLFDIMGSEKGFQNYVATGMLKKDRVHFTNAGYQLQGILLANAIVISQPKLRIND